MIEKEFRNEDPPGKIIALVLSTISLYGGNSLAVKISLQGIPPLKMAFLRYILGAFAVGGVGFFQGMSMRLRFEEVRRLSVVAVLHAFHTVLLNIGTELTIASRSTIFFALYPIFTVVFGHFWLPDDRLSVRKILGVLSAFGGVIAAIAPNLRGGGTLEYLSGDLIVTLAACLFGLRITLTKVFVQDIYPHRLLVWLLGLNIPCFLVLSYFFERGKPIALTLANGAGMLYQGWILTGFCFLTLTWVLRKYKASKLTVLYFFMPVSGVLFSNLLLGDELPLSVLAGTVLIAGGIYLVNLRR
ncbi:MAG: DMT family transporter [Candidatus Poribacteria bacterium]|nr:DMT family transporter [Candidatus Poribacteria bacterium]